MAMASPNVVTVWVPLQRTPPEMGSLAFAPPPPAGHDAWTLRELPGCPMDEKSDEYDKFVASALEEKGVLPGASNGSVSAVVWGRLTAKRVSGFQTAMCTSSATSASTSPASS